MQWELKTAIKGACDRLISILVTSNVTGLGILPLAVGHDDHGPEIQGPMAIVILGGLLTIEGAQFARTANLGAALRPLRTRARQIRVEQMAASRDGHA